MKTIGSFAALSMLMLCSPVVADLPALVQTDTSKCEDVTLKPAAWTYAPTPPSVKLTDKPLVVKFPNMTLADQFYLSSAAVELQFRGASRVEDGHSIDQWCTRRVDLQGGVIHEPVSLPGNLFAFALSDDGAKAAVSGDSVHSSNSGKVYVVEIKDNAATAVLGFTPYATMDKNRRQLSWAHFIDKDLLLTCSSWPEKRVVLWDLSSGTPTSIWGVLEAQYFDQQPLVTADNKYVVLLCMQGTCFLDARTGKVVGFINDPVSEKWNDFEYHNMGDSLRPDGLALARLTASHVDVFSLGAEPERLCRIYMPPKMGLQNLVWAGQDHLLLNHKYLVDLKKGMIVWTYGGIDDALQNRGTVLSAGGRIWVATADGRLQPFTLPDESTQNALAKLDLDKAMAVHPGMKVSLAVDIPDARLAESLRTHFQEELKNNDMTIADGQPIVLRVKFGAFPAEKVAYRNVNMRGGVTVASVEKPNLSIAYDVDGKILWDYVIAPGAPLLLSIKAGETLDTAIRRDQGGAWSQVQYTHLPKYVATLRDPPGFGQTLLEMQSEH